MKNRIVISVLAVVVVGLGILLSRNLQLNKKERGQLRQNVDEVILLADQMYKNNNYEKANQLYGSIVSSLTDIKKTQEIKQRIDDLNIKMLFSPTADENSIMYTVQKGDTLTKIAQQNQTTVELIKRANKLSSTSIRAGETLKVTQLRFNVVVDKSSNQLFLKSGETLFKTYTVSTGKNNCTPVGRFKIINKLYNPTWFKAGAVVPSGSPENILGPRWMGFDKAGYGIHGTTEPQTIGQQATAGCIRMRNEEVVELFDIIPVGTEVTVLD